MDVINIETKSEGTRAIYIFIWINITFNSLYSSYDRRFNVEETSAE